MPDARGGELAGVQVGDVLHDLVKGIDVVTLHGQRGLVGVELHLREKNKVTASSEETLSMKAALDFSHSCITVCCQGGS